MDQDLVMAGTVVTLEVTWEQALVIHMVATTVIHAGVMAAAILG